MSELDQLRPTQHQLIIDLVQEAGINVSDWANGAGGLKGASTNPRYCFEWAFVEASRFVVINLWHRDLVESDGIISARVNMRGQIQDSSPNANATRWRRRAESVENALRLAADAKLPVRIIVLAGQPGRDADQSEASRVSARLLDAVPWAVIDYSAATGTFTLVRGAPAGRLVDQFSAGAPPDSVTELRNVSGVVFVRRADVRQYALNRANGRCEWCSSYGFLTANGSLFLETHHVVPLSEGGSDTRANVVAICANHHREAHFGAARITIRARLQRLLESCVASDAV